MFLEAIYSAFRRGFRRNMRGFIGINLKKLAYNFDLLKSRLPAGVLSAAVVKADAYGHGEREVIGALENSADYFVTATVEEAERAREITAKPILCLARVTGNEIERCILKRIELSVSSAEDLNEIICASEDMNVSAYVHICLDTGMNRMGIKTKKALYKSINALKLCRTVAIKGVYSHFFDGENAERNEKQYEKFITFLKLGGKAFSGAIKHISSTAEFIEEKYCFDMVRFGIGIYGYGAAGVKPCLTFKSYISRVAKVKKGEKVGYGGQFIAEKDCYIATISAGYGDGIPRSFSGGTVLIGGKRRKIVGSVCMDYCFALADGGVKTGDEVVFIGSQGKKNLTAEDMANACNTISYEILTGIKRSEKLYE